ncbi:hypothetical protein HRR80_9614 [Exophiala dermatitidis]|uniref:Uncharacterized protein n=1 Tax=Exophiala dermatitidis TaxID=5970 RepID=A0AAN6EQ45_EXODE|nr:hypothetical protein HRR80_9614 [Exophiala dermatitidis]KAJ9002140.1 hypothetical protein HRR94_008668 [Exophiala dermatitidis]
MSSYLEQVEQLLEDLEARLRATKAILREAREASTYIPRNDLKRSLSEIKETDKMILKERTALAANRVRVKYGMQSQLSHLPMKEGYMKPIKRVGGRDRPSVHWHTGILRNIFREVPPSGREFRGDLQKMPGG